MPLARMRLLTVVTALFGAAPVAASASRPPACEGTLSGEVEARFACSIVFGTYTLANLGMGKASVAAEGGVLYTAAKTSTERGEVTLELRSVKKSQKVPGALEVRGRYRARLLPVGAGRSGDVVVDVRF